MGSHPPLSLSGTSIISAMRCPRQAWLQDQLAGDTNDKAVIGQMLHELLQWALSRTLETGGQEESRAQVVVGGMSLRGAAVSMEEMKAQVRKGW